MDPEQKLQQRIAQYKSGIITSAELLGFVSSLAADLHPSLIVTLLPADQSTALREQFHARPLEPEEYVSISGALHGSDYLEPAAGDDDMKWYAGLWRLHFYFRSF